jgi:Rrf2 family protein
VISITSKSPYGLSALVELARSPEGTPVPVAEIARKRDVPAQFLEQICATMRRAGLLRSQRGVKGGFLLAKPASEITALAVVECLDGAVGADREAQGDQQAAHGRHATTSIRVSHLVCSTPGLDGAISRAG